MRERIGAQLGTSDPALLDDLTQEGIIQLLRLARREATRNLGGVVTVVARSVAIDEIRRRQRQRVRFQDWENVRGEVERSQSPLTDAGDSETLWFLLLEFFRSRKAPCLQLARAYAEQGNWRDVALAVGRGYEAVRQQWARCTKTFRSELRRHPGPFQDWTDGDV
jgi:DNA-directed RNA polymerase specialized sigma24 family protein